MCTLQDTDNCFLDIPATTETALEIGLDTGNEYQIKYFVAALKIKTPVCPEDSIFLVLSLSDDSVRPMF